MVLDWGQGTGREIAVGSNPAVAIDEGDAVLGLRGQPPHHAGPCDRIGWKGFSDQGRFTLEGTPDLALEIPSQRTLGGPEENPHREDEDEHRSRDQPPDERHRLRAPRSFPLKR